MTPYSMMFLALVTIASLTSLYVTAETQELQVKYYTSESLYCINKSMTNLPKTRIFWITPKSEVIEQNPSGAYPKYISFANDSVSGSVLQVSHIEDDLFGYYTCVMIDNVTDKVTITRYGLNIDGADFSELEKQYRENAIIGAIAAAVMLVLVGGGCLIWNYRYSKRGTGEGEVKSRGGSSIEDDEPKKPTSSQTYQNAGYDVSEKNEVADVDGVDPKINGSREERPHSNVDLRM